MYVTHIYADVQTILEHPCEKEKKKIDYIFGLLRGLVGCVTRHASVSAGVCTWVLLLKKKKKKKDTQVVFSFPKSRAEFDTAREEQGEHVIQSFIERCHSGT